MFDGRGRYYRFGTKTLLCELLALDMARFTKYTDMTAYSWGSQHWTSGNGHESSIAYQVQSGVGVRLMYTNNKTDSLDYVVRTTSTRCNYGGRRYWWVCPSCGRRCRVLYGGRYFVCWKCSGAYYETQKSKDMLTRIDYELTAIRRKLKANKTLAVTSAQPARPKGMHVRTYMRLGKRYYDLQYYRVLSIGIDIAKMGRAMGITTGADPQDLTEYLKWLITQT